MTAPMTDHGEHTAYDRILEHFRAGGSLSPLEALQMFGCMRLAAVVHRMRKRDGVNITSIEETGEDGRRWARYCLGNAAELDPETVLAGLPMEHSLDPWREGPPTKWKYVGPPAADGLNDVAQLVLKALPGVREPNDILRTIKFKELDQNKLPGVSRGTNRPC